MTARLSFVLLRHRAKNPPHCHSEPFGEESRFAQVYCVLLEILRFAQDDKFGFVSQTVGAIHESPVDFDVILRNNTEVVPYS